MTSHLVFVACILAAGYSAAALGQINKCLTREGRTVYQEAPCAVDDKASAIKKPGAGTASAAQASGSATRKPEEDRAVSNLVVMVSVERDCKALTGRYASMEEMIKGCVGPSMSSGLHKDNEPRNDPDYDYRLSARVDGFELSIAPRKAGLSGYFTDGKSLFENSSGAATSQSKRLGPLPF